MSISGGALAIYILLADGTLTFGVLVIVEILGNAEVLGVDVLLGDNTLLTKVLLAEGRITADEAMATNERLDEDTLLIDVVGTGFTASVAEVLAVMLLDDDALLVDVLSTDGKLRINEVLAAAVLFGNDKPLAGEPSAEDMLRASEVLGKEVYGDETLLVREAPVAEWDVEAGSKLFPFVAIFSGSIAGASSPSSISHSPISS